MKILLHGDHQIYNFKHLYFISVRLDRLKIILIFWGIDCDHMIIESSLEMKRLTLVKLVWILVSLALAFILSDNNNLNFHQIFALSTE